MISNKNLLVSELGQAIVSIKGQLSHVILFFFWLCLLSVNAHSACNPMTYAESQDSEFRAWCGKGSVYTKDNNTWVLSEYAVKRFAMPDNLAVRSTASSSRRMLPANS